MKPRRGIEVFKVEGALSKVLCYCKNGHPGSKGFLDRSILDDSTLAEWVYTFSRMPNVLQNVYAVRQELYIRQEYSVTAEKL